MPSDSTISPAAPPDTALSESAREPIEPPVRGTGRTTVLELRIGFRVFAVAVLSMAAAWVIDRSTGSSTWAGLAGVAVAAAGSALVARWTTAPVRRLLAWASHEDIGYLRFLTGDEWQTLARLLFVRRRDALARATEAEAALARQSAAFLTMADGVLITDKDGRIDLSNRAAAAMFGTPVDTLGGHTVLEATMSVPLDQAVQEAIASGEPRSQDLDVPYPTPRRLRAVVSVSGVGEYRAAVVVLHDLTDAARLDAMRRDFVANVSHEFRTPVAGILTNAENLLSGALEKPDVARHAVRHIESAARRLASLVDDLLSLARAEARKDTERAPVAVGKIARAVVAELDPAISEKHLDVSVDVPDEATIDGVAESVRQILRNLVDNAVKYTDSGGTVEVRAAVEGPRVRITVSDTGIGILRQHQVRVFERFYRVDPARSREAGGTGLGLSIVKHLVESMNGTVTLTSEPERGSTFTVLLPKYE